MDDPSQNKVDMSLDDIIKLNRKEKRQAKKEKISQNRGGGQMSQNRGRGQVRGRGQGRGQGRGRGQIRGIGRGQIRGRLTGRGRGQQGSSRGAFSSRGRGKEKFNNAAATVQPTTRALMRGVNHAVVSRRGRGRGRGRVLAQQKQLNVSNLSRQTSGQDLRNLRSIGRGRGNRGGLLTKRKQLVFTNSLKRQQQQQRSQQLLSVKAQASLLQEKATALKNLQQAKKNMQTINAAIQQTSRDTLVNQRRGINTNGAPRGRGRGKLLAGLMSKSVSGSMSNLSTVSNRQMVNTSVTISNPGAGPTRRRQWRANKGNNVVLQVGNRSGSNPGPKPSFVEQLKKLKPSQPTTYKFQKNMFAAPSTSLSLNDRFSSQSSTDGSLDGRKVFV